MGGVGVRRGDRRGLSGGAGVGAGHEAHQAALPGGGVVVHGPRLPLLLQLLHLKQLARDLQTAVLLTHTQTLLSLSQDN